MIAVIADDLTGAAEMGGLGLQRHLKVELHTAVPAQTDADLLVIATDTRSLSEAEAVQEVTAVTRAVARLQPSLLFKKIDSVLRGHVLAETAAMMEVLQLKRALILPANPLLQRTISDGIYYFQGKPIEKSAFAHDPEFPISSSRILDMLRAGNRQVALEKPGAPLPEEGMIIGEVKRPEDLNAWARQVKEDMLLAGGAGIFSALLKTLQLSPAEGISHADTPYRKPALFVCGSTFSKSREALKAEKARGGPVSYMPAGLVRAPFAEEGRLDRWTEEINSLLDQFQTAQIAIDANSTREQPVSAASLREKMALAVCKVLRHTDVPELFIEGGATASAVLRQLGISRFYPVKELAPGVIRMRTDEDLTITMKPGSYDWPERVAKIKTRI